MTRVVERSSEGDDDDAELLEIDFLLPNSLILTIQLSRDKTLNEIQKNLEAEIALRFNGLFALPDNYIFTSLNEDAEVLELFDLSKKLADFHLFSDCLFLKVVENKADFNEKRVKSELSKAVGISTEEMEMNREEEIVEYRVDLMRIVRNRLKEEQNLNLVQDNLAAFEAVYAPSLEVDSTQLELKKWNQEKPEPVVMSHKPQTHIEISIFEIGAHMSSENYEMTVPLANTAKQVIEAFIKMRMSKKGNADILNKESIVLNVCGCDEVLFNNKNRLASYKYIQKCLSRNMKPTFFINTKEKLRAQLAKTSNSLLNSIDSMISDLENRLKTNRVKQIDATKKKQLSWDIEENFSLYLDYLGYYPQSREYEKIFLELVIYHGQELVAQKRSEKIDAEKGKEYHYLSFGASIEFDLKVKNLHRCAKLCLSLNYLPKRGKERCIGWISLNLFDQKGCMLHGRKNLFLWPSTEKSFASMCLSGVTGQNTSKEFCLLKVEFAKEKQFTELYYPSLDECRRIFGRTTTTIQDECCDVTYALENDNNLLMSILNKDPLFELTEQEKSVLWIRKGDCLKYPNSLPKLLQAVKWSSKQEVIEIYSLLGVWPDIKPAVAIELLSAQHFDLEVRSFAVKCLDKFMRDEDIQAYILQLVQALKNELYFSNSLVKFLLKRALKSQRVGIDLFWSLRSEMKNPKFKFRFGLIIEAFCRGIGAQIGTILRQIEAIESLSSICVAFKGIKDNLSLIKSPWLKDHLLMPNFKPALADFINPLNRSQVLGTLETEKCRILSSAKRPLYLSWSNTINYAMILDTNHDVIFKHGDDLRQDMLTIQILKLMNTIWKNEGLDLW